MTLVLLLLSFLLLLLIAWHDIRHHSIPLVIVILEAVVAITIMVLLEIPGYWQMVFLSFVAASVQTGMLWGWFRVVRKSGDFFDSLFGWGDIVMIVIVAIHFSVFPFIVFMVVASLAGLLWHYFKNLMVPAASAAIPLAGIIALLLIPVQLASYFDSGWFYYNPFSF